MFLVNASDSVVPGTGANFGLSYPPIELPAGCATVTSDRAAVVSSGKFCLPRKMVSCHESPLWPYENLSWCETASTHGPV